MRIKEGCFGYLLGKGGETKEFLQKFSGAKLRLSKTQQILSITGRERAVERAKLAVNIMLKQRINRFAEIGFGDITNRPDSVVLTLTDQEYSAVMGLRGSMLRRIQQEACVFIFFDSMETYVKGPRHMAIISGSSSNEKRAIKMVSQVTGRKFTDMRRKMKESKSESSFSG
eukprot:CAMPEP_0185265726 /NCGR_PEP_ID=MMETSP1359-20130426/28653_1 /TAXON_ID=552665 /ORGANISM="Bigelowiella longifila, Strain CCMP242" /LENGTH=170 /DNA_ID=CAMNT_0027855189 /DNA_START=326 /DNA_END=838 /DNA_ORIENTATION=-